MGILDSVEKVQNNAFAHILCTDGSDYDQSNLGDTFRLKS